MLCLYFAIVYRSNDSIMQNIITSTLLINLFKTKDIVCLHDRKMEKIAFNFTLLQYHRIKPWLLFVCFSAHPCTVISYCNVMFNGIKHIIPQIASILELISSENQCTFSYERLQTWSNATFWLHAQDMGIAKVKIRKQHNIMVV